MIKGISLNCEDAWTLFDQTYRKFIAILLTQKGFDRCLHEDIAQEVMTAVWKSFRGKQAFRSDSRFRTWLAKVVSNTAINHMRQHKRHRGKDLDACDELELPQTQSATEQWIEQEWQVFVSQQAIEQAMHHFKGKAVPSFEMHMQGKSRDEISRELKLSKSVVSTYISRVKKTVIKKIQQMERDLELVNPA
jgi:RNA polymerase sigma-70 factor (ECF subfamily)